MNSLLFQRNHVHNSLALYILSLVWQTTVWIFKHAFSKTLFDKPQSEYSSMHSAKHCFLSVNNEILQHLDTYCTRSTVKKEENSKYEDTRGSKCVQACFTKFGPEYDVDEIEIKSFQSHPSPTEELTPERKRPLVVRRRWEVKTLLGIRKQ